MPAAPEDSTAPQDAAGPRGSPEADARRELERLARWEGAQTWSAVLARNQGKPPLTLEEAPLPAQGPLTLGHALHLVLRDMVVRSQNLLGLRCAVAQRWASPPAPTIEREARRRLRAQQQAPAALAPVDARAPADFVAQCRAVAREARAGQELALARLGLLAPAAADFAWEARSLRALAALAASGRLQPRSQPVLWELTAQAPLREDEVEPVALPSGLWVSFAAAQELAERFGFLAGQAVRFAAWTDRGWALPATCALGVDPQAEYVFYALGPQVLVVGKERLSAFLAEVAPQELRQRKVSLGGKAVEGAVLAHPERILGYAMGEELSGLSFLHPLRPRHGRVLPEADPTPDAGSGLWCIAPGHGMEDFRVGLAHGLPVECVVRADGRYDGRLGPPLAGAHTFEEAPALLVAVLAQQGALLRAPQEAHAQAGLQGRRSGGPVIVRAGPAWWLHPLPSSEEQPGGVCISREGAWGAPIAAVRCVACQRASLDAGTVNRVAEAVERQGVEAWWRTPVGHFLPPGFACPACGGADFAHEEAVLVEGFEAAALRERVDLILEAGPSPREASPPAGNLHPSAKASSSAQGASVVPERASDRPGAAVPRRLQLGQVVERGLSLEQALALRGAEGLRLWLATHDCRDDVEVDAPALVLAADSLRPLRAAVGQALARLAGFEPARDALPVEALHPLDAWALRRCDAFKDRARLAYGALDFPLAYRGALELCREVLAGPGFEAGAFFGPRRRSAQTALARVLRELLVVLSPVLPFTAEEAFAALPGAEPGSVFLSGFPEPALPADPLADAQLGQLLVLRAACLPLLREVGAPAQLVLAARGAARGFLRQQDVALLPELLGATEVHLVDEAPARAVSLVLDEGFPSGEVWAVAVGA